MSDVATKARVLEQSIEITVIRCGCGNPQSHIGKHCPTPRKVEDRGIVSYWHRNPLKRVWWNISKLWRS